MLYMYSSSLPSKDGFGLILAPSRAFFPIKSARPSLLRASSSFSPTQQRRPYTYAAQEGGGRIEDDGVESDLENGLED